MGTGVTVFKSTDTGAPVLTGQVGAALALLEACLIMGKCWQFATAGSAYSDKTSNCLAAQSSPSTFAVWLNNTAGDICYFGQQTPFSTLSLNFGTFGVIGAGAYVWEYWNGSAWTTLTVTDGTTNFSVNGLIAWTKPGSWATTAVNGTTLYWVRVRLTTAFTTAPVLNYASILGWFVQYDGTNQAAFRMGFGTKLYFNFDDNGSGTGGAKEAIYVGYETMSALDTGTNRFPTSGQQSDREVVRKSASADATARNWILLADQRTWYLFVLTGDIAGQYFVAAFGDFYSFMVSDAYNSMAIARDAQNSNSFNNDHFSEIQIILNSNIAGHYIDRAYTQAGGSVGFNKSGHPFHFSGANGNFYPMGALSGLPYPTGPDSKLYLYPVIVLEGGNQPRGSLRGIWEAAHSSGSFNDGDTASGTDNLAGRSFLCVKAFANNNASGGTVFIEVSDTWDTN